MSATEGTVALEHLSQGSENEVMARVALAAAQPLKLEPDTVYAVRTLGGDIETVRGDDTPLAPKRPRGTVKVYDADSFGAYFHKHNEGTASEVYADPYGPAIIALLNGHGPTPDTDTDQILGHGDHRISLTFRTTPAWQRWTKLDGQLGSQVVFAQHLEDSLPDIVEPEGALMLELAQSFQAHTKVTFESARDLSSSERQLVYREEVEASAGRRGDITIPKDFTIGIAPYEGSSLYRIKVRLRYQISDGALRIGYRLDRPEDVLRAAFDDVLRAVQDSTGRTALLGQPA